MPYASPIYDPGHAVTVRAQGAAIVGCRFLKVAGAKVDGGNILAAHCGASDEPFAVSGSNTPQNDITQAYGDGFCLHVEAGGTVTAGQAVEVMANGVVQNYSSGRKVGVALTSAVSGEFPLVRVRF